MSIEPWRTRVRAAAAVVGLVTFLGGAAIAQAAPEFAAGGAVTPIHVGPGMPLGGWLRDPATAEGVRDALDARALVLVAPTGHPRVGLVALDVPMLWPALQRSVSERVSEAKLDALLLAATGTQSGPGGYADAPAAALLGLGRHRSEMEEAVAVAAARALREATAALEPARLGTVEAAAPGISRNAERPDGPVDERVPIVRIDAVEGGALATLFAFAAPAAVLSPANRAFSGDYPRHARRRIEAVHGGVALFVPGAVADQAPQRGGLDRRRGDVAFEVEAATEIGNALGLVVAAQLPLVPMHAEPQFGLRTAALALPPPRAFAGCPHAPLARLGRGLMVNPDWRAAFFGRDPGPTATIVALRVGALRFVFSPFVPSAALAAQLRERVGSDVYPVAHTGGWLGDARTTGAAPGEAACRDLFGPAIAALWLEAASNALAPLR